MSALIKINSRSLIIFVLVKNLNLKCIFSLKNTISKKVKSYQPSSGTEMAYENLVNLLFDW